MDCMSGMERETLSLGFKVNVEIYRNIQPARTADETVGNISSIFVDLQMPR